MHERRRKEKIFNEHVVISFATYAGEIADNDIISRWQTCKKQMTCILIIIAIVLLIFYLKQKYFTFHDSIPGLKPQFLFGNLLQSGFFNGESPPHILVKFKKCFGDTFQFWFGPSRFIIINNIIDIEHIFTHRNIYDQGDIFIEKFSVSYSQSLISTKGLSVWIFCSIIISIYYNI